MTVWFRGFVILLRDDAADSHTRRAAASFNGSGVELRRPGTRFLDDITLQAGGREANPPATRRR
jgi:hypothetical protein